MLYIHATPGSQEVREVAKAFNSPELMHGGIITRRPRLYLPRHIWVGGAGVGWPGMHGLPQPAVPTCTCTPRNIVTSKPHLCLSIGPYLGQISVPFRRRYGRSNREIKRRLESVRALRFIVSTTRIHVVTCQHIWLAALSRPESGRPVLSLAPSDDLCVLCEIRAS